KLMLAAAVRHYNEKRPHSSLEYMTPSEFRKSVEKSADMEVIL
ncbi:MAG: integrase core domain-containing protein, partial [Thermoplasmata archaeon]|nr:integrase core domain-containing protein [Candidatus Sysuiplasma acidicola]